MSEGIFSTHDALKSALKDYIVTHLRKSPVLLEALQSRLDDEGVLFREPYVESSAEYEKVPDGMASADIPNWMRGFFSLLAEDGLGVYASPFRHQITALEKSFAGKDLFVSTGTGSGKTECFLWPLMAALAREAHDTPSTWKKRGVRCIVMYPMNALVSDQISRLRRLMGDEQGRFVKHFRACVGENARRPQFGMYTGRTPYPGSVSKSHQDKALAGTLERVVAAGGNTYIGELKRQGRIPAKADLSAFVEHLRCGRHITDPEDAELITRFEMQALTPDILITNYSMLEYMLFRPHERGIWENTRAWLDASSENRLLFVIDEAHMYKGAAGGEVALLLRRLFHRLGISRERVQFILTTASMPNANEGDRKAVREFAGRLTAADGEAFYYLTGSRTALPEAHKDLSVEHIAVFSAQDFSEEDDLTATLNRFWKGYRRGAPFSSAEEAGEWLFEHLTEYRPFRELMAQCRGTSVSLSELASAVFPNIALGQALPMTGTLLSMLALAKKGGNILFPVRAHMLFRGIQGLFACSNPDCPHSHSAGGITLGEVTFSSGRAVCPHCGAMVYELYRDRRCGALFFKGYILEEQFKQKGLAYLWRLPGQWMDRTLKEIHLYIPPKGYTVLKITGKSKITPCYLDIRNGFLYIGDDDPQGKPGIRKLYYCAEFEDKGRPNLKTFHTCPHCGRRLGPKQILNFAVRGNFPFYNLIRAQFEHQPPVREKVGKPELPNEGRKVLLFSDSRQGAATLARDMSDASDLTAARQLFALALKRMSQADEPQTLNDLYGYFALEAGLHNVHMFSGEEGWRFWNEDCAKMLRRMKRGRSPDLDVGSAPAPMQVQLLRLFCSGYNTASDIAMAWLEPEEKHLQEAMEELEDDGIQTDRRQFVEMFNAWMLNICRDGLALGHQIADDVRELVLRPYEGCGLTDDWKLPSAVMKIMGWPQESPSVRTWKRVLQENFLRRGRGNQGRYYVDLDSVVPRFDMEHVWYRCSRCSGVTAMPLKGACPNCGAPSIQPLAGKELEALEFWKKQMREALEGAAIRVIDTEEHTAQLSYKDQRDELWSRTEEYELRFQDIVEEGVSPVDILSSTTTMEVGIDIGSLVAVGLRNVPPLRENYQQRAGRAGRRGTVLSTIVTFCENGPHDALYFHNPAPMFRGDPRRPWIDTKSSRLLQRHLSMVVIQDYCERNGLPGLDEIAAEKFLGAYKDDFLDFLETWPVLRDGILLDKNADIKESDFRRELRQALSVLYEKWCKHPELYESTGAGVQARSLLDALYEESIIPTYSFPKNVVSVYITDESGHLRYQVSRGLDIAISEYAPGRGIVVDKNTYQIGGLYSYGSERYKVDGKSNWQSPARSFVEDSAYLKPIVRCPCCHWFGLASGDELRCPFCGAEKLEEGRPMLKPWGFAPVNAESMSASRLDETYSWAEQPLYSTLPESGKMELVEGCRHMRMADRSGQRIIMMNSGEGHGFYVCRDCGAAVPALQKSRLKQEVGRPYRSRFGNKCRHTDVMEVDLGYDFITDMLVLECTLDSRKMDTQRSSPWLERAALSLSEALRLQVCQKLDIEFTELVSGYRIRENKGEVFVDLYLYDSISSGAGYAVGLVPYMAEILRSTERFLSDCNCEDACHQCLKHYRNRHIQGRLDRFAALDLLRWCVYDRIAEPLCIDRQKELLKPFLPVLENYRVTSSHRGDVLFFKADGMEKKVQIYPAMWKQPMERNTISISDAVTKYARPMALKVILDGLGI